MKIMKTANDLLAKLYDLEEDIREERSDGIDTTNKELEAETIRVRLDKLSIAELVADAPDVQ